jgi:peroxiredoxin
LRSHQDDVIQAGARIVAIGTGSAAYARRFVVDEQIPYLVLVDDGRAAASASVRRVSFLGLFHPRTWAATRATRRRGYRVHRAGPRVTQLGATFVIGPGDTVRYAHLDDDSTDHAPVEEVLRALPARH